MLCDSGRFDRTGVLNVLRGYYAMRNGKRSGEQGYHKAAENEMSVVGASRLRSSYTGG